MTLLKYFLTLAFVWVVLLTNAQIASVINGVDEVEILAGPSLVSLKAKLWEGDRIKIAYTTGVGALWELTPKNSIAAKFLIERKGIKDQYETNYFDNSTQNLVKGHAKNILNLDYLTIPITYKRSFGQAQSFGFELGCYGSYLFKAQFISKFSWSPSEIQNERGNLQKFDAGISFGFTHIFFSTESASLGYWVSANHGLINIGKPSAATVFQTAKTQSLSIGFKIIKFRHK